MLTLKLTPREFAALLRYLDRVVMIHESVPLTHQRLSNLVLAAYLDRFGTKQLGTWSKRRIDKEYTLNVPLAAAKALHDEMQYAVLVDLQQLVLNKLDLAIVNYQKPILGYHKLLS